MLTQSRQVWLVENKQLSPLPEAKLGFFHEGKSYVCLLSYTEKGKSQVKSIAYFWDGSASKSQNYVQYKADLYRLLEEKMRKEGGGPPRELRVTEGKEPDRFLEMINYRNFLLILRVLLSYID